MEPAEILQTLRATDYATVPREALTAARERREEIVPALLASLDEMTRAGEAATAEQTGLASYALYLLAEFRETAAFPAMERLFRLPDDLREDLTGDIFIEDGPGFLAATAGGAGEEGTGRLRRIAEDAAADPDLQRVALRALNLRVAWEEAPRDEAVAYLARYFHERWAGFEEDYDVMMLAHLCLDLGVVETREDIRAALDRHPPEVSEPGGFPIPPLLKWEEVEEEFREGPDRGWRYLTEKWAARGPAFPTEEACAWWHADAPRPDWGSLDDGLPEVEEFLPHVAPPKIGRNDPCPCGSEKKFKKCCGG